jgi:hypothetical protein
MKTRIVPLSRFSRAPGFAVTTVSWIADTDESRERVVTSEMHVRDGEGGEDEGIRGYVGSGSRGLVESGLARGIYRKSTELAGLC